MKIKIEFVFVGVVLGDSLKVYSYPKRSPRPVLVQRVKLNPFRNYNCFNYHSQCLRSKVKFVWGCGASRGCGRISISNSKGLVYYFKGLSGAHLDIAIVLTITVNVWEENKVCVGGVVLADSMKVFPFLKIKPPPSLSLYD